MPSTVHLIGGDSLHVEQPPEEVARLLWGEGAPEGGYATLGTSSVDILVNPSAVAYVTGRGSSTVHSF